MKAVSLFLARCLPTVFLICAVAYLFPRDAGCFVLRFPCFVYVHVRFHAPGFHELDGDGVWLSVEQKYLELF